MSWQADRQWRYFIYSKAIRLKLKYTISINFMSNTRNVPFNWLIQHPVFLIIYERIHAWENNGVGSYSKYKNDLLTLLHF